jgi:hypothetical protein
MRLTVALKQRNLKQVGDRPASLQSVPPIAEF